MREYPAIKLQAPVWKMNFDPVMFMEPIRTDLQPVELSLFAITRDSGYRIQEFIAFHKVVGVERFIICLHDCVDDTEEQIKALPFYDPDTIVIHKTNATLPQMGTYNNMFHNYGYSTKWAMVIDDDEFFFSLDHDDLKVALKPYEAYGGVTANWQWFGSNNHVLRPDGLIIENYTKRASDEYVMHKGCKSIIQIKRWISSLSPHRFETDPDCVNEYYHPATGHWDNGVPCSVEHLRVNHYKVRSIEDWVQRQKRGDCVIIQPAPYDVQRFKNEDRNDVEDTTIWRFLPKVKEVLTIRGQ
jgi:hypothetical protein